MASTKSSPLKQNKRQNRTRTTRADRAVKQTRHSCRCHSHEVELEVELPGGDGLRHVALLVEEGDAQLNHLQVVDVTPPQLVLVILGAAEFPYRPRHHTRELCVLGEQTTADTNPEISIPGNSVSWGSRRRPILTLRSLYSVEM